MTELLRRALALVPEDVRNDVGASAADVREQLEQDEWDFALDLLGDFGGVAWQTPEYWALLTAAAKELHLPFAWFEWRGHEARQGLFRADLRLAPARRSPIPAEGVLRPLWLAGDGGGVARLWVESMPELPVGGRAVVRLLPLSPDRWRQLAPGDVLTMHEGRPVTGTATVIEYVGVGRTRP
ncbi:hypothetical protein SAMN05216553_11439 [Lentzea fradiae]|uniref:Uncharacterized protein n=1 Tax=Lentzea fradiae TaxID=200378 RepID=A0A1G7YMV9_9PSEU|nr:hypothetical protein [Lentzea fradiae]SDG97645.1 hypothetical protein SAMN05216553_11439 [Lentzea fradiae]